MDMMLQPALQTYESTDCPKAKAETDEEEDWSLIGLLIEGRSESIFTRSNLGSNASSGKSTPKKRRNSTYITISPTRSSSPEISKNAKKLSLKPHSALRQSRSTNSSRRPSKTNLKPPRSKERRASIVWYPMLRYHLLGSTLFMHQKVTQPNH